MITHLSDEVWAVLDAAVEERLRSLLSDPLDEDRTEKAIRSCYRQIGDPAPKVVFCDGPTEVLDRGAHHETGVTGRSHERGDLVNRLVVASWLMASVLRYVLINEHVPGIQKADPQLISDSNDYLDAHRSHAWLPLDTHCFVSRQHTSLHRNDEGALHNQTGPAWEWKGDGTQIFALEGIRVPGWVLTAGPDQLMRLGNQEQKRVALNHYGWERAVVDLDMEVLDEHPDPHMGTLYLLPRGLRTDDVGTVLIVRNNSPHPGGHWEQYALLAGPPHQLEEPTAIGAQAQLASRTVAQIRNMGVRT